MTPMIYDSSFRDCFEGVTYSIRDEYKVSTEILGRVNLFDYYNTPRFIDTGSKHSYAFGVMFSTIKSRVAVFDVDGFVVDPDILYKSLLQHLEAGGIDRVEVVMTSMRSYHIYLGSTDREIHNLQQSYNKLDLLGIPICKGYRSRVRGGFGIIRVSDKKNFTTSINPSWLYILCRVNGSIKCYNNIEFPVNHNIPTRTPLVLNLRDTNG